MTTTNRRPFQPAINVAIVRTDACTITHQFTGTLTEALAWVVKRATDTLYASSPFAHVFVADDAGLHGYTIAEARRIVAEAVIARRRVITAAEAAQLPVSGRGFCDVCHQPADLVDVPTDDNVCRACAPGRVVIVG